LKDLNRSLLDPKVTDEVVDLFYAESASVIYFLIKEFGENRFETFCRKLKYGSPFFEAMKGAYGRFGTVEELNQAWVDYLKKKL